MTTQLLSLCAQMNVLLRQETLQTEDVKYFLESLPICIFANDTPLLSLLVRDMR